MISISKVLIVHTVFCPHRATNSRPEKEKVEGERAESRLVGIEKGSGHRIQSENNKF